MTDLRGLVVAIKQALPDGPEEWAGKWKRTGEPDGWWVEIRPGPLAEWLAPRILATVAEAAAVEREILRAEWRAWWMVNGRNTTASAANEAIKHLLAEAGHLLDDPEPTP